MTKGEFAGHKKERQTCENSCSSRRRCSHLRYRAPQWLNIMVIVAAGVAAMMLRADMTAITGPLGTASPLMTTTGAIVPTIPVIAAMLIGTSGAIDTNGATRRGDSIINTGAAPGQPGCGAGRVRDRC